MNILCTIFELLGLVGYLACLSRAAWPDALRVLSAGAVLCVAAALALLCKENGILVFAYALAMNLTLLREEIGRLRTPWRHLLRIGVALPIVALVSAALVQLPTIAASYRGRDFTLGQRLLTQPRILFDYVREIVLPRVGDQGIFHDGFAASTGWLAPPTTLLAILALAALAIAAWRTRVRWPVFAFAVLWFLAGHLIESTVIPLELYFEHRNYVPMIGLLFAAACGVAAIDGANRKLGWALLGLWFLLAGALTSLNAKTWGDRGLLATVWVKENPDSVRAAQMLAAYQYDLGHIAGSKKTLQDALARMPQAQELAMQVALLDCDTVGLTRQEWNQLLVVAGHVRYSAIVPDLASRFGEQQRGGRCHGTLQDGDFFALAKTLVRNPNISWRGDAMGYLYYEMARQAVHERNLQETIDYMDTSYAYVPNPLVPRNQAIYLLTAGLPDDAMRYLAKSDNTPQPWMKRRLLDIRAMNAPLWHDARELKHYMQQHPPHAATPSPSASTH